MDIYEEMKKHLSNEYDDVAKYVDLSKADANDGEAQILRDIAHEEYMHARHLKSILKGAGIDISELHEAHEKAEAAIHSI